MDEGGGLLEMVWKKNQNETFISIRKNPFYKESNGTCSFPHEYRKKSLNRRLEKRLEIWSIFHLEKKKLSFLVFSVDHILLLN